MQEIPGSSGADSGVHLGSGPKRGPDNSPSIKILKAVLSVLLLYHLATVFIMPNSGSLIGRQVADLFLNYANLMGFNTTWQFFSPGPAPTYYLEYQLEQPGADGEIVSSDTLQYPPERELRTYDDYYNRRLFGMRFFTLFQERLEKFFVPFLCRQNPKATAVTVQSVFERIPNIERADKTAEFKDMSEREALPRQRFECPQTAALEPSNDPALSGGSDGATFDVEKGGGSSAGAETGEASP